MNELIEVSHNTAIRLALSGYIGRVCTECKHEFSSVEDIQNRELVCSKKDENGIEFACKECFKRSTETK